MPDSVRNWLNAGSATMPHAGLIILAWVLAHQRVLDNREQQILHGTAIRWGMKGPFVASIDASLRQNSSELLQACRLVATHYRKAKAGALMDAAIDVATADNRLSTAHNHALRFIADLVSLSQENLAARFQRRTGHRLPAPSDCSRAAYWRRKKRSDRTRQSSRRGTRNRGPAERAADILGVAVDADTATLTRAYRRKAQQCHPDRVATEDQAARDAAARTFRRVRAAYEYLRSRA
jgi:DnaJ-domain-containing protein 1